MTNEELIESIVKTWITEYPDELLPPKAMAKALKMSPKTLATMRCRGGGPPAIKSGRRIFYPLRDGAAWFAGRSFIR
ncbi:MAG: hypothetical protein U5L00_11305 [Desulfovermiculus sp.]|nr:hypothetical protein [Desulfovermiculus sp.]